MNYSFLKSRTVWTVFFMFLIGGLNSVTPVLPPNIQAIAVTILSALAVYFHTNPSQTYTPPQA